MLTVKTPSFLSLLADGRQVVVVFITFDARHLSYVAKVLFSENVVEGKFGSPSVRRSGHRKS